MPRNKSFKSSKKKSVTGKPAKYVIPPASPIARRSMSARAEDSALSTDDVSPLVQEPVAPPLRQAREPSVNRQDTKELMMSMESRWDERFSRMEKAIRSGLTSAGSVATIPPVLTQGPAVTAPPAAATTAPKKVKEKKSKSDSSKKKSKHRSPSTDLSSSEPETESDSSSSSSSDESESETEETPKKKIQEEEKRQV